ncbi:MAG: anti-sigma factor [Deltaproteobacteria bacterium]|nr:anti-sigma factor [Deltaproteobacteria bacterium]
MSQGTDRRSELLADRALDGLSELEARELIRLGGAGDESYDQAAAVLALAELARIGDSEALPEALAGRVLSDARARGAARSTPAEGRAAARARSRWSRAPALGWMAAAAAAVIAVFGWTRSPGVVEKVQVVEVTAPPPRVRTPGERRAELLAQAPDATTTGWSATPDPAAKGANGDVVWSESRQQGYMRIRGLAANDPKAAQYQLWIFDGRSDQAHPVDGGVFDVVDGEVIVPIRAAIQVFEPKLFAVTVERPGGVVVSKRERIVLTAAL